MLNSTQCHMSGKRNWDHNHFHGIIIASVNKIDFFFYLKSMILPYILAVDRLQNSPHNRLIQIACKRKLSSQIWFSIKKIHLRYTTLFSYINTASLELIFHCMIVFFSLGHFVGVKQGRIVYSDCKALPLWLHPLLSYY